MFFQETHHLLIYPSALHCKSILPVINKSYSLFHPNLIYSSIFELYFRAYYFPFLNMHLSCNKNVFFAFVFKLPNPLNNQERKERRAQNYAPLG